MRRTSKHWTEKRKRRFEAVSWHKASHKSLAVDELEPDIKERTVFPGQWKKIFQCKKLKGPHDFELIREDTEYGAGHRWATYRCKACGKLKNKIS